MREDSKFVLELPGVELVEEHNLPAVRVSSAHASGLVYLQGAHVAAWQPTGQAPVIWMSENAVYAVGKALRGGVPICFPWFGPHAEKPEFPAHGFARTRAFEYCGARLDATGRTELELSLNADDQTRALFPHAFAARLRVAFGKSLELSFSVTNHDSQPFSFEEALHSYFGVADVTQTSVRGLEGARYVDKVREQSVFTEGPRELRFVAETDRVYESTGTCTIDDRAGKRSIVDRKGELRVHGGLEPVARKSGTNVGPGCCGVAGDAVRGERQCGEVPRNAGPGRDASSASDSLRVRDFLSKT